MNCADNNHATDQWNSLLEWIHVWRQLMDLECFSCFYQVSAFSSLVGGSCDRVTTFCFSVSSSVVHFDVFLVISYMRTHVVDTSLHQATDRSRRHHTLQFTHMSHRSWLVVLWKTIRKWCPVFHVQTSHRKLWKEKCQRWRRMKLETAEVDGMLPSV